MIDYSKELNEEQLAVVYKGDGPCLVLAGAGSGKTRTITYRVAHLLEKGIKASQILLLTFTNKAAFEMAKRVGELTARDKTLSKSSEGVKLPWSGTFHSIANKILRQNAHFVGYEKNFTILDKDDSDSLIRLAIKNHKGEKEGKRFPSVSAVGNIISYATNSELPLEDVVEAKNPDWMEYLPNLTAIRAEYTKTKKESNSMDFDDLLVNLILVLQVRAVREKYQNQFKYILVDEYQDTNKLQASIIKHLVSDNKNILVVGDDAQSIYSFRAADVSNILQFEKTYQGARVFRLETNYRSFSQILDLANGVIANNLNQYPKKLRAILQGGIMPVLKPTFDQTGEAKFIVDKLEKLIEKEDEKDVAVLFRASHHSQPLELELVRRGISYDYRGGLRFFARAHIKDVLAYLRIFHNQADTSAWLRLLLHEEGVGPAGAMKIVALATKAQNMTELKDIGEVLGAKSKIGWNNFLDIYKDVAECSGNPNAMIEAVRKSSYANYLVVEYIDGANRLDDIGQLATFAKQYSNLEDFLAEASLVENFDIKNNAQKNNTEHQVVLSTIHQSKGLEWDSVFIINLSSGAFPNDRALREEKGLEEERRLFYVAITRAKKNLFLSYPMSGGGFGDSASGPSLFIDEINPILLDDQSIVATNLLTSFDDLDADVRYIPDDDEKPFYIRPGSFLRDIEDL